VTFSTSVTVAARRATRDVPVVFAAGADPVQFGLIDSFARPGGRLTGVHFLTADLSEKRIELTREILPNARRVITFYNPANPAAKSANDSARKTAELVGIEWIERHVSSPEEVRERLREIRPADADAYFFVSDSMVIAQDQIIVDAMRDLRIPTVAYELDLVSRGALAGYGLNYREVGRLMATYVSRILAGTHSGDLPVQTITRIVLAINLKTAKALGITVPPTLLARADEVIE
jgi:putative tryptophan/tyrosine transport system substrate-binding protein